MGYIEKNLMDGEEILHRAKLHWWVFLKPVFFFSLAAVTIIGGYAWLPDEGARYAAAILGGLFAAMGLMAGFRVFLDYISTELAVTTKRLMVKYGFIRRNTVEMSHRKVESLQVRQGLLGRILNFGTVIISGTGGTPTPYHFIANPLELRRVALEAEEGLHQSAADVS